MTRLPPNSTPISPDQIETDINNQGLHRVVSSDTGTTYMVCLNDSGPSCECMDWGKSHLPCKHMLSVFINDPYFEWENLPHPYRDCPHFNLDPVVTASAVNVHQSIDPIVSSPQEEIESPIEIENVLPNSPTPSRVQQSDYGCYITSCINVIKNIQSNIYNINSVQNFIELEKELESILAKTNAMVPREEGLPVRQDAKLPRKRKTRPLPKRQKKRARVTITRTRAKKSDAPSTVVVDGTCDIPEVPVIDSGKTY